VAGYDITSILDFKPPKYLCQQCRGLLFNLQFDILEGRTSCPVCKVQYRTNENARPRFTYLQAQNYLAKEHLAVRFDDVTAHSKRLAELIVTSRADRYAKAWPTMRLLLTMLSEAKSFVHFATYGISHQLLGALKLTSMRVPVCGWASNVDPTTRMELTEWPDETPNLKAKAINSEYWRQGLPHQKLVVIDGLIAFKGSANLTTQGLRKVDHAFDMNEVVTDLSEVRRLNNTLFSNVWANIDGPSKEFLLMGADEPF
jgi:phosphatidylserine/phosphatidylglycerophosphate/cardiolipin synthase-like enzyme